MVERSRAARAPRGSSRRSSPARRGRGRAPSRPGAPGRPASTGACAARARRGSRATRARRASSTMQPCVPPVASSRVETSDPVGVVRGQRFSKNRSPARPVGGPHQGRRPAGEMGQHRRRDPAVVVDDVGLAETRRRGRAPCRGWRAASSRPSISTVVRSARVRPAIRRMEPYAECDLDRVDQLRPRAGARAPRRRHQEQRRQLQPARRGHRRAHPLQEGVGRDRRRGAGRAHRAGLRGLEGSVRHRSSPSELESLRPEGRATRSTSRSSSTSTRSTRSTSSSRTTSCPTSAARSRTRCCVEAMTRAQQGRDRAHRDAQQGAAGRDPADRRHAVRRDDALRRRGRCPRRAGRPTKTSSSASASSRWRASWSSRSRSTSSSPRSTTTSTASRCSTSSSARPRARRSSPSRIAEPPAKVLDLIAALEASLAKSKTAKDRHPSGTGSTCGAGRQAGGREARDQVDIEGDQGARKKAAPRSAAPDPYQLILTKPAGAAARPAAGASGACGRRQHLRGRRAANRSRRRPGSRRPRARTRCTAPTVSMRNRCRSGCRSWLGGWQGPETLIMKPAPTGCYSRRARCRYPAHRFLLRRADGSPIRTKIGRCHGQARCCCEVAFDARFRARLGDAGGNCLRVFDAFGVAGRGPALVAAPARGDADTRTLFYLAMMFLGTGAAMVIVLGWTYGAVFRRARAGPPHSGRAHPRDDRPHGAHGRRDTQRQRVHVLHPAGRDHGRAGGGVPRLGARRASARSRASPATSARWTTRSGCGRPVAELSAASRCCGPAFTCSTRRRLRLARAPSAPHLRRDQDGRIARDHVRRDPLHDLVGDAYRTQREPGVLPRGR